MDDNPISVVGRHTDGRRYTIVFQDVDEFRTCKYVWLHDIHTILAVKWGDHLIYNALVDRTIQLDDLIAFFE